MLSFLLLSLHKLFIMRKFILKAKRRLVMIRIALRRFRHRIRSKRKKILRRKSYCIVYGWNKKLRDMVKGVKSYKDILRILLPRNLRYMINNSKCLFFIDSFKETKYLQKCQILVPEVFSIIDNAKESFEFLQKIINILLYQTCKDFWIDYKNCKKTDLLTEVFLDAILRDFDNFYKLCQRSNKGYYVKIRSIGGQNYNDGDIHRMVYSVGSPAVLTQHITHYDNVIPFNLICFDAQKANPQSIHSQKEADTTKAIEYVENCLKRMNKTLSPDALREMGCVIGETLVNAEEHSNLKYRYMVGYFEECKDQINHSGLLNLVIMNFGQSIYEKFNEPDDSEQLNKKSISRMRELSSIFTKKKIFKKTEFTEETLWTLYSLQQGVTCVPDQKRGNGTIQFIESFFKLKEEEDIDNVSKMYILSGNSMIVFDGKYRKSESKDENGNSRGIISFNDSGSLEDKPDIKYVKHVDSYFPGTAIFIRILLKENEIRQWKKNA